MNESKHMLQIIMEPSAYSRHSSLRPYCVCGWVGESHSGYSVRKLVSEEFVKHVNDPDHTNSPDWDGDDWSVDWS